MPGVHGRLGGGPRARGRPAWSRDFVAGSGEAGAPAETRTRLRAAAAGGTIQCKAGIAGEPRSGQGEERFIRDRLDAAGGNRVVPARERRTAFRDGRRERIARGDPETSKPAGSAL